MFEGLKALEGTRQTSEEKLLRAVVSIVGESKVVPGQGDAPEECDQDHP